jgi:diacylglycerol O-acyltransferase
MPERLSTLDASFLYLERPEAHYHVGGLAILDPLLSPHGPISLDRLRTLTASRLHLVPRFRQRVMFPPLRTGRPVWVDDPHFDLDRHLGHVAVAASGSPAELAELVGHIHSQPLDLDRPLWEMVLIDGLEDGHQAILAKTHHAMLDGVGGMDLTTVLFDATPEPQQLEAPIWQQVPLPSGFELAREAVIDRIRERAAALGATARNLLTGPSVPLQGALGVLEGAGTYLRHGLAPRTDFNVRVGSARRFAMTELVLDEVRAVKTALGGTVNDVLLSTLAAGLCRLLEHRGEPCDGRTSFRTMMPVSTRSDEDHGKLGNRVSLLFADLPVGAMDPVERLRQVSEETRRLKVSHEADAASALIDAAMWLSPTVHRRVARFGNEHLRIFNLVASNIPGPQLPLYLDGAELVAYYPLMPLGETVGLSVAVVTLVGVMGFGFTADWRSFRDLQLLALFVREAFDELKKAAEN